MGLRCAMLGALFVRVRAVGVSVRGDNPGMAHAWPVWGDYPRRGRDSCLRFVFLRSWRGNADGERVPI